VVFLKGGSRAGWKKIREASETARKRCVCVVSRRSQPRLGIQKKCAEKAKGSLAPLRARDGKLVGLLRWRHKAWPLTVLPTPDERKKGLEYRPHLLCVCAPRSAEGCGPVHDFSPITPLGPRAGVKQRRETVADR